MKETYSVGIDMGGTNTDIGIVRNDGTCIARERILTATYFDINLYVKDLASTIKKMLDGHAVSSITGIGIGAPNGNYYTGCIEDATNLNFKGKVNLKAMIEKHIDAKVTVSNDANAAAYGEMIYGGAKGMRDFIMFTLGTGVGSGIVINGQLVIGHDSCAGELGHAILFPHGRHCNCGRDGCLEEYASARGITKTCIAMMKEENYRGPLSLIPEKQLGCKAIADAANSGDPLAVRVFEYTGKVLGLALSNAVVFSSPEAIFLMGGPVKAGNVLLQPLRQSFEENLLFVYKGKVKILESQLSGNDAAILGAAALTF